MGLFHQRTMPNSFGVRARTRDLFAKRWGTYGMPSMSTYLKTFKRGEIVDIVANPAIHKRIHVRIEHVKHSKSRLGFLLRVKENEVKRKEAQAKGVAISLKRSPVQPVPGHIVKTKKRKAELLRPVGFEFIA